MSSFCYYVNNRWELSLTFLLFKRRVVTFLLLGFFLTAKVMEKKNLKKFTNTVMPETKFSQYTNSLNIFPIIKAKRGNYIFLQHMVKLVPLT